MVMKKKLIFMISAVWLLLIMSSCNPAFFGGQLSSDYDEFMDAKRSTLLQSVNEKNKINGIESATITYTHEIRNDIEIVELFFAVSRSPKTFDLERMGYVKAGEKMFDTPLKLMNPVMGKRVETITVPVMSQDTTALMTTEATTSGTTSYLIDKFSFRLAPEAVEAIKNGGSLSYRFYFGPVAATYNIRGMKLSKVKKLLLK